VAGPLDNSTTRVRPFFRALLGRDASGRSWLPALISATPGGPARFGELTDEPGSLISTLAVRTPDGSLGAFEHPVAAPRDLLEWFIDHPQELSWPKGLTLSSETVRLRRALIYDLPPGSRAKAQKRARDLLEVRSALAREWWRFEGITRLDCVLITDRIVITVEGKTEPLAPATAWYPPRSQLVRTLEAASTLGQDRRWASVLISEHSLAEGARVQVEAALPAGAPHLDSDRREELLAGYLGNLTWAAACAAVGLPLSSLPDRSPLGE
jgi:hypothetical protein